MELLIVEDESLLGRSLEQGLTEAGHRCDWVRSGAKGLELAKSQIYDAVVLDRLLPDLDGLTVLKRLRGEGIRTPILMLTALGAVEERVEGLESGADDYLVKPFAFPELIARLNALERRLATRPAMTTKVGSIELDLSTRKVKRGDRDIDLSPTEFSILELLMRYAGQVVTRKMLSEHLWNEDWGGMTNVLDVHINHLRRKLDRGHEGSAIQTVRGRGYVLRVG